MNEAFEQEYGYLWNSLDKGWVLLESPELPNGYIPFNKVNSCISLIECEEVNKEVCRRMKEAGCEVLQTIPKVEVRVTRGWE